MLESTERKSAPMTKSDATAERLTSPDGTTASSRRARSSILSAGPSGVQIPRKNTVDGVDPMSEAAGIQWEKRSASISDASGSAVFKQDGIDVPTAWSQTATNIVANKYFRGTVGTPERETSVRQLILRVTDTLTSWGRRRRYFASEADAATFHAELSHLLVTQKVAFNSPVWFNVGVEAHPQCSACFINSVDDTMESILGLAKTEGMLFKFGSGAGSNLSTIRSSKELLAGGGTASGPVSFMRGFDAFAGVIKSGGKTRRAAKMVILNVDHPDVLDFVDSKMLEEKKAWALIEQGYDGGFNVPGGAYDSVYFQNANHSVRVNDTFMQAVVEGRTYFTRAIRDGKPVEEFEAKAVWKKMAQAAWLCGDPGVQYDTTINDWHTCKATAPINASNPCSSSTSQRQSPNRPPIRGIINTNNATPNTNSAPTNLPETSIHHHTPSPNHTSTPNDPHNTTLNSPTPNTNDRHNHRPTVTHTNRQPKSANPQKPSTNIMQYILKRSTNTLINASSSSHPPANAPISNATPINNPTTTNDTNNTNLTSPSPTTHNDSTSIITNNNHHCHPTLTDLNSNPTSPTLTINEITTNFILNSTTSAITATYDRQPAATTPTTNMNSTSLTDNETDNSHQTAMDTMDNSLYSLNPLSTPTPDCEAVPETVG